MIRKLQPVSLVSLLICGMVLRVDALTVGFLYAGPKNDAGWNSAQDAGRDYVEKNVPGVKVLVAENVPETGDSERVMERMARAGASIIFATSYGYFDNAVRVAQRFPNVVFMYSGDEQTAPRVADYCGSTEDAMYIAGIAAGYKSKTGKLGYIDAYPIPILLRGVNAFTLGAQSVNPNISVQVTFLSTYKDPVKEAEAANSLIDQGVDVLAQEVDSNLTILQIAERRGVSFVGQYFDASKLAPHAWLVGNYYEWGPLMVQMINEVEAGNWKEKVYYAKLGGALKLTAFDATLPPEAKAKMEQANADFAASTRSVWVGPIYKQDGTLLAAQGTILDSKSVAQMNFFVQGVIGSLGQ
jgi:basic membrane protein A